YIHCLTLPRPPISSLFPYTTLFRSDQLIAHNVKLESVDYLGKRAAKITEDGQVANGEAYAIVKDAGFHNGTIEVELAGRPGAGRSEEHTSELQSRFDLVCRLLLEKK